MVCGDRLIGKVITNIKGLKLGSYEVIFEFEDRSRLVLFHDQECCERVRLVDIVGDPEDLLGEPLIMLDEATNFNEQEALKCGLSEDGHLWTFYKLATIKGYVTLRWLGESNGYYAMDVRARYEL